MRSRRKVLAGIVAGTVAIAGLGWAVGTRLRSPADEAAARRPPEPSLITFPVTRRKLTSMVAVNGTLAYGSPLPVTLAGVVGGAGGGSAETQRVTRAPHPGKITEGSVLMEVNGRPVFALRGKVPMHRTMAPGTEGADVEQLQSALRRLGLGAPRTGVFDAATAAAVRRWYAGRGYVAQEPDLTVKQARDTLRQAVQSAEETLLTDRKALDAGRDVMPLKLRFDNAREDLRAAEGALEEEESRDLGPEETRQLEDLRRAVRTAEETALAADQALAAAKPEDDKRLLEMRASNARQDLESARAALADFGEQAEANRSKRLEDLRKALRLAQENIFTTEQALRQARQNSPLKLKIANGEKNVASARAILAEYMRTYGTGVPPGEIVFLPTLPARLDKADVKPGDTVKDKVATVTSSTFTMTGSVEVQEAKLLREGMKATMESSEGDDFPAVLSAVGEAARPPEDEKDKGAQTEGSTTGETGAIPVLLTPATGKDLRRMVDTPFTVKITVGATGGTVLTVPVAAVITSADGRPRVRVAPPDNGPGAGTPREVEVRTGLTADGAVEVEPIRPGTLKEGDRVVVSGDS
ncbi:peptidoglycan-binding protein [Streptosporangium sp. NPDC051023]|uniref:peptidoglycan-binding protein n=1 Tax=Streptosporangium sp. NPDC051023 TaxID=3155410 RepID=UPI00344E6FC3